MTQNPYAPPLSADSTQTNGQISRLFLGLVPPLIAAVITLLIWVLLVSMLDRRINANIAPVVWSATLLFSLASATALVSRYWHSRPSAFAFSFAFTIFATTYCLLEGDVSGGDNRTQASIVYGTMIALPVLTACVASLTPRPTGRAQA